MTDSVSGRPSARDFHVVDDERQARMLMDESVRRIFRPFLARERTVGEAAAEVGCEPSVMLYRVGTLLRAGLLVVVREEPRPGRAIKVYRSSFDAYMVPYALTPFATLEESFYAGFDATARRMAEAMAARFRSRGWDGYRLSRYANGEVWLQGAPDASKVSDAFDPELLEGTDFSLDLHLTRDEAKALHAQLNDILQRFRSHEAQEKRPGERLYLLSAALVLAEPG